LRAVIRRLAACAQRRAASSACALLAALCCARFVRADAPPVSEPPWPVAPATERVWRAPRTDSEPLPVWIVLPRAETCVQNEALLAGIASSGPFRPSFLPASVTPSGSAGTLFRLEGKPERLVVHAWGLQGRSAGGARAELEQVLEGQSCDTVTEAAVALIVSLLPPEGSQAPPALLMSESDAFDERSRPASTLDERAPAKDASRFGFPLLAGSLLSVAGVVNGAWLANATKDVEAGLWYGSVAPVLGGLGSYFVSERDRESVLLLGYWSGVASTSLVVAVDNAVPKTMLVGGGRAGGAGTRPLKPRF
jgi:hypothetical protein